MTVKPGWARKRDRLRRREAEAARAGTGGLPWALSPADWRLLVITFVAGLGSIVAAACVIGGALALAKSQEHYGLGQAALATAGLLCLLALTPVMYGRVNPYNKVDMWAKRFWIVYAVASVGFVLLFWIGVAAGIK